MKKEEIWLPIVGYEGFYEVSSLGGVRSVDRVVTFIRNGVPSQKRRKGKVIKPGLWTSITGYVRWTVNLNRDGKSRTRPVSTLVAGAFLGPRPVGYEVAHRDGDSLRNAADNLRYATTKENAEDKVIHGTTRIGEANPLAKLTMAEADEIRSLAASTKYVSLAKMYNVNPKTIRDIVDGKTWLTREQRISQLSPPSQTNPY